MRSTITPKRLFSERMGWIAWCLVALSCVLIARLIYLHVLAQDFLRAEGNARSVRVVTLPHYRGMITDRRGEPLAISTPVSAYWVDPRRFAPSKQQIALLAEWLEISPEKILDSQQPNGDRAFLYLKRDVLPYIAEQVDDLNVPGLYRRREFRRYYPAGASAAQLVGFTDIDDQGQSGVELYLDEQLRPTEGKKRVLEDRAGQWIRDLGGIQPGQSGDTIHLSIDARIQDSTYQALLAAVEKHKAKSATAVMIYIPTGEVLSIVTAPSFNPNIRSERTGAKTRLRAITDPFEPGSTIKAFTLATALESGRFQTDTPINTNPGRYELGGFTVRDVRNYGQLTFKDVLIKSSNVGIIKVVLELGAMPLIETFESLRLGSAILLGLPGEHSGQLHYNPDEKYAHASFGFGYGFSVTALQLAQAYAVLGAKGVERLPTIFQRDEPTMTERRVLDESVSETLLSILAETTQPGGTGKRANIPGFKTAGKTGTVRLVGPSGYDPNRHLSLFAGVTPVDNPLIATAIVVEEPQDHYYGGLVSAPLYAKIVGAALHILNHPPDDVF